MAAKKTKVRKERRDRRKAKASGWKREGTKKPKKVAHHNYDAPAGYKTRKRKAPPPIDAEPEEKKSKKRKVSPDDKLSGWGDTSKLT